jgi:hypothetical protein
MSDFEIEKRPNKYKRNKYAKALYDPGEHKGAFGLRIVDDRKGLYKRKKLRVTEVIEDEED